MKRTIFAIVLALAGVATSCGTQQNGQTVTVTQPILPPPPSTNPPDTTQVPQVVGERLDVAENELTDKSLTPEVLGGGTFGSINHSDWKVCATRPFATSTVEMGTHVEITISRQC